MKPVYWIPLVLLFALPVLLLLARSSSTNPNPSPSPTPTPQATQNGQQEEIIQLDNLSAGQTVSSPLTITGTVPPGWMFEASFPISILDENGNVVVQSYGEPIPPDDWMSGEPVRFSATLTFETEAQSGLIRFEKDNPSGLPENAGSYDIPVQFAN